MVLCSAAGGVFAQDQTINGDLKVVGKTLELNGRQTHVLNYLSGNTPNPTTDSYRYEVARLCVNTYHWQPTGPIEIELRQAYFGSSGYLKFVVTAGYQEAAGSVTLLEKFGSSLHANVSLGTPVATGTSFGGYPDQYIPVYVDLGNYTYWHVQLTHGWTEVADDIPTTAGRLKFFANPAATILPGYVATPGGDSRLESRELFAGKIGIGTTNPARILTIDAGSATSRLLLQTTASGSTIGDGFDILVDPSGNAGVWNYEPGALRFATSNTERMLIDASGNVGIGTTNPGGVGGTTVMINSAAYGSGLRIKDSSVTNGDFALLASTNGTTPLFRFFDFAHYADRMVIDTSGNVGIGTTSPTHKLAVNGTIRAKEVIVDTGWADYVFKPDYKLASLSEVEGAIKRDGHLPGIPSAAEVAEHGVSMGEMQAKLLAKVEELTLHVIAQEKRMGRLESENATLRREVETLKSTQ